MGRAKGWHSMLENQQFRLKNDANSEILESHCAIGPVSTITFKILSVRPPNLALNLAAISSLV